MLSSPQNAKVKLVRALAGRPKERREAAAFLAEGVRLVEEALVAGWPFRFALHGPELSPRGAQLVEKLREHGVPLELVDGVLLRSLSETETSQGILAVLDERELSLPAVPDFLLIPDSVRDPGNLGTLLRSAEAAGVQAVLLPPETADAFAPKVVRAGMGAHFRLPIRSAGWTEIALLVAGMPANRQVYLAEMGGASCWQADFKAPLALIIGGEAAGATQQARQLATRLVSIPMLGGTESLNAAVAGSVLMFEVLRQRTDV
jgi:RNA methyltransferase, TrmH family